MVVVPAAATEHRTTLLITILDVILVVRLVHEPARVGHDVPSTTTTSSRASRHRPPPRARTIRRSSRPARSYKSVSVVVDRGRFRVHAWQRVRASANASGSPADAKQRPPHIITVAIAARAEVHTSAAGHPPGLHPARSRRRPRRARDHKSRCARSRRARAPLPPPPSAGPCPPHRSERAMRREGMNAVPLPATEGVRWYGGGRNRRQLRDPARDRRGGMGAVYVGRAHAARPRAPRSRCCCRSSRRTRRSCSASSTRRARRPRSSTPASSRSSTSATPTTAARTS